MQTIKATLTVDTKCIKVQMILCLVDLKTRSSCSELKLDNTSWDCNYKETIKACSINICYNIGYSFFV